MIPGVNSYQVLQPLWGISPVKQLRLREGFVYELVRDQRELWDHGYLHPIKVSPRRLGNILGAVDRKHSLNHLVQLAALGQLHTE